MDRTPDSSEAHESAAQLMPWLVNGTLAGEEAARLRTHLDTCESCRRDLETERRLYEAVRSSGPLVFAGEPSLEKLMARIETHDDAIPRDDTEDGGAPEKAIQTIRSPARGGRRPVAAADIARGNGAPRERAGRGSSRRSAGRSATVVRWLAAAVVIEAVTVGLGAWTWHSRLAVERAGAPNAGGAPDAAPYRTLTTPAASYGGGARVRVVFRPELTLGELRGLLERVDAHIVDGPTEARVYTLGFSEPAPSERVLESRIAALRADPHVLFAEPAGGRPP